MIADLATVAVLGFIGMRLVQGARFAASGRGRQRVARIVRGIRWRHLWPVPIVLVAVITAAVALVQLPVLSFGWWTALGGTGNPVTGASDRTSGTVLEWLVPVVFMALLVPALPLFAEREEELFRLGAEQWTPAHRVGKALQFGLVHAIIGIPIGAALALSIGGGYFQLVYLRAWRRTHDRREATLESTRAHTAYNACIIGLVIVLVLSTV